MNYQVFDAGDNKVLLGPEGIACKKGEASAHSNTQYYIIRIPQTLDTNLNPENNYHIVVNNEISFAYYRTLSGIGTDPFLNAVRKFVPPYEYEAIGAEATHRGLKLILSDKDYLLTDNVTKEDGGTYERVELYLSPDEVYNSRGYVENGITTELNLLESFETDKELVAYFTRWKKEPSDFRAKRDTAPKARVLKVASVVGLICAIFFTLKACSDIGL